MTQQEILEGNKLIAEFMGSSFKTYKKGHIRKDSVTVCYFDDGMSPFSGGVSIKNLKFHSSWDWLMPVVEKIEKDYWVTVTTTRGISAVSIHQPKLAYEKIARVDSANKIEAVWLAVVEFIKWYNENKNK